MSDTPRTFCGGCGADVTTSNGAGIYACSKCGSTWRIGGCAPPVLTSSGPVFAFGNAPAAKIGEQLLEQRP